MSELRFDGEFCGDYAGKEWDSMVVDHNAVEGSREYLEAKYGKVWDTKELQEDFFVEGFLAPFASVNRKRDNVKGTLEFQHSPRFYFNLWPDGLLSISD